MLATSEWFFFLVSYVKNFHLFTERKHFIASLWHIEIASVTTLAVWDHYEVKQELWKLWYRDSRFDNWGDYPVTHSPAVQPRYAVQRDQLHPRWDEAGQCQISSRSSEQSTIQNLWTVYFWDFPFNIFRWWVTDHKELKPQKAKPWADKGGPTIMSCLLGCQGNSLDDVPYWVSYTQVAATA